MMRLYQYFWIFLSVIFVVALGASSLPVLDTYQADENINIVNGELAGSLENYYNEKFPIRNIGVNLWTALQYGLLREGKRGVIIGEDNWLFTEEEFKAYAHVDKKLNDRLNQITQIHNYLNGQGVMLVLAIIPAKTRIVPEHLGSRKPADFYNGLYERALSYANEHKIIAPDLLSSMLQHQSKKLFLKTDTHWTPEGASIAANAIAKAIADSNSKINLNKTDFTTELVETRIYSGDLLNFIPLGPFSKWIGPKPDKLNIYETYAAQDNANNLFGNKNVEIALVGSSYSANSLWNFAGSLKDALGHDLINYAQEGKGPVTPMLEYLASGDFSSHKPKILIWEFPERYLPVEYDTAKYKELNIADKSIMAMIQ